MSFLALITLHMRCLNAIRRIDFLYKFLLIFSSYLLYLLLCIRPITTLGKSLIYNLLEIFNWVKIKAIQWPIKDRNFDYELGFSGLSCIQGSLVHLYSRWGRIKGLVGVKIGIKLHIVVVELLQLWVIAQLEA